MGAGKELAAAALALVGSPFRLHGRDAQTGLDCVGVAAVALKAIGHDVAAPENYRLRGGSLFRFDGWAKACGLHAADAGALAAPGDILLCTPGPMHFHVMVDCGELLVHAHLALGRVVAWPQPAPWPVHRRWRLQQG